MYIADLHIHSMYSRATSKTCVPEHLDLWARRKGIQLLGTGDFTHPAWREELREKLVPAEDGLYVLKDAFRLPDDTHGPLDFPRFVVSGEISSIYKKNGKTRKVHNVILLPSLEAAEQLSYKLEAIGNIHSDGRPILGLDSRDLLEITLETCPEALLIPAHIWTPHFSMFGAFSGFDTIEECFEDLTPHIRALETGLSSDPPMNWRVSMLDAYTLISNSDAHSPAKLGREANLLEIELSYPALIRALCEGQSAGFRGTIEFFPEEGKYHHDGHRNCQLCLKPSQTREYGGRCPICGKKLTIGVLNRVEQLADREEGYVLPGAPPFESLVPLPEVIASSLGKSVSSSPVTARYQQLLRELGPEFYILRDVPLEDIEKAAGPCICEGIRRLREGRVERTPGYDGEYGKIQLLNPLEIDQLNGQLSLFQSFGDLTISSSKAVSSPAIPARTPDQSDSEFSAGDPVLELNAEQLCAVTCAAPAVAVIAGPGTGKTKTLVARIAYLVEHCGVKPSEITAVTFTNQAASEMRARLEQRLGKTAVRSMTIGTFHSICLHLLGDAAILDEYNAREVAKNVLAACSLSLSPQSFLRDVSKKKNGMPVEVDSVAYDAYCRRLEELSVLDFDDLLLKVARQWPSFSRQARRFSYLLVDEFQDINPLQYQLIRLWHENGKSLFVIGDPDQTIYGFRGSDSHCFSKITSDFPSLATIRLKENYRSTPEIVGCALSVLEEDGTSRVLHAHRPAGSPVRHIRAVSDLSGAIYVAKEINRLVGGIDMLDAHQQNASTLDHTVDFSDIAILYRTHREAHLLEKCLKQESIPYCIAGRDDFLADPSVRGAVGFFQFLCNPKDLASLGTYLSLICAFPTDAVETLLHTPDLVSGLLEHPEETAYSLRQRGYVSSWVSTLSDFYPRVAKSNPRRLLEEFGKVHSIASGGAFEQLLRLCVFSKRMPEFLQNLLLGQERDLVRGEKPSYASGAVTLMTLHGSKGLEFPVVFVCGVNLGQIPLESKRYPTDSEEERRLFYVGMTRAQDELILLSSDQPSPYLELLPKRLVQSGIAANRKRPEGKQLTFFDL